MNREIKFRGWDKDGTMYFSESSGEWLIGPNGVTCRYCNDRIMQYAGLKDKTGKDIFEGDIVQVAGNVIYEIKYTNDSQSTYGRFAACFTMHKIDDEALFMPFDEFAIDNCEVIGNIHQHPHLLP